LNTSVAFAARAFALAGLGLLAGRAAAQPGGTRPPIQQTSGTAPTTGAVAPAGAPVRVAVVNINAVLKGYNKAQSLNAKISEKVKAYADQMNKIREQMTKLQTDGQKALDVKTKEGIEKDLMRLNHQLQDLDDTARREVSKEQGETAVLLFKEVEQVIKAVAVTNGFDLVLSYPDATTPDELYSPPNVVRKLASQAAVPMFYKPHIDLTSSVVTTLNQWYPMTSPAAPAAPPAGSR
jgi:Skp family chaperone for outer membrane proteins